MTLPLMPKATAVWLVDNTTLSFDQIAQFCGMHPLEVQGIADGDVAVGIKGENPIKRGLLTQEAIDAAQDDESVKLRMQSDANEYITSQKKIKSRYTPVARRQDKPDAIAWFVKHHPEVKDAQISKLIGTTKSTITAIRNREHWNIQNIKPRDPVLLGLCTQTDLQAVLDKYAKAKPAEEAAPAEEVSPLEQVDQQEAS